MYIYIYWVQLYIYALFCFVFLQQCIGAVQQKETNENKQTNKQPRAGEFVIFELALIHWSFHVSCSDWLNYPTVLVLWEKQPRIYKQTPCYMWKPLTQRRPRSRTQQINNNNIWVERRVRQPPVDLRSRRRASPASVTLLFQWNTMYIL